MVEQARALCRPPAAGGPPHRGRVRGTAGRGLMSVARPSLGLVIPVYNEAERLTDYAKQLFDFAAELPAGSALLFVDDGSTDGTPNLIADLIADTPGVPARVVGRPHMGKGAAVAAGLRAVRTDLAGF